VQGNIRQNAVGVNRGIVLSRTGHKPQASMKKKLIPDFGVGEKPLVIRTWANVIV
jgi:hypothetical protein